MDKILTFAAFFAMCFGAASSGAYFRPGAWYAALKKPSWTPPNWAFPVVWTTLFLMMSIAGFLIFQTAGWSAWPALALFAAHLVVNAVWSWIFFGLKRLDWAMAEVLVLWAAIAALIALFAPINTVAALLLAPYLLWVTIAAFLNFRLLQLNGPRGPQTA